MITLGPILGYEWDRNSQQSYYTVIIRTSAAAAHWEVDGQTIPLVAVSPVLHDGSRVLRGEVALTPFSSPADRRVAYRLLDGQAAMENCLGESGWEFIVPGQAEAARQPHLAFCSCNGFKQPILAREVDPLAMWRRMEKTHRKKPLHLLVMGGDQLYCDDLAREPSLPILDWLWMTPAEQKKRPVSPDEEAALKRSYLDHYPSCWVRRPERPDRPFAPMIRMMASVPSVMMWDDHDIFDGYGSYEDGSRNTPFFRAVYAAASQAFEIYQLRGWSMNRSKLDAEQRHYSLAVKFGHYTILALDTRSGRTPEVIMPDSEWDDITSWLHDERNRSGLAGPENLLVIAPIPVVYRRFKKFLSQLPGQLEVEDDVVDHWNHSKHECERNRLIAHLFNAFPSKEPPAREAGFERVVILSGDVHVGGLGYLRKDDGSRSIPQIISSGIMHLPPGAIGWSGVMKVTDGEPYVIKGQGVTAYLERPNGAEQQQLVTRNFVHFFIGTDNKLWVNWECEDPDYPLAQMDLV